ncbi:MAG: DUF1552 domain-containing protein [Pseudomonadota bacterium]
MARIKSKGRRQFLIGAGKTAIALPFLNEIAWMNKALAETSPIRLVTMNYANGLPPDLAAKGLVDGLASLAAIRSKVSLVRNINGNGSGTRAHRGPGMGLFVGKATGSNSRAAGPSMDYVAYNTVKPSTKVDVLSVGIGGNTETLSRYVRSWRGNLNQTGSPVAPEDRAETLFRDIFGEPAGGGGGGEGPTRDQRIQASVLDAVVEEYKSVKATNSGYSPLTKRKISEHLDRIYEVERSVLDLNDQIDESRADQTFEEWYSKLDASHFVCQAPMPYRAPRRGLYEDSDRAAKADAINYPEWCWAWPVLSELFGMALVTNYTNFGSLVNGFAGERYKNIGPEGNEEHHEYYHKYNANQNAANRVVVEYWLNEYVSRIAKTLLIFDSIPAEDGKTLLDTTAVVVGTEHDFQHRNNRMTFFVAGRPDAFNLGQDFSNTGFTDVDLYNTILRKIGVNLGNNTFGDASRFSGMMPFAK